MVEMNKPTAFLPKLQNLRL